MVIHEDFEVDGRTIKYTEPSGRNHYFVLDKEQMEIIAKQLLKMQDLEDLQLKRIR